jgi:hypothetical protein
VRVVRRVIRWRYNPIAVVRRLFLMLLLMLMGKPVADFDAGRSDCYRYCSECSEKWETRKSQHRF